MIIQKQTENFLIKSKSIIPSINIQEKISHFMYLDNQINYHFVVYGNEEELINIQQKLRLDVCFRLVGSSKDIMNLNQDTLVPSYTIEYLSTLSSQDLRKLKIIVFDEKYPIIVNKLVQFGINPIEQIFDGHIILGTRDEPDLDIVNKLIFSASGTGEIGGIFEYDIKSNSFRRLSSGDFREIKQTNNGYIALDEERGIICFNKNFEIEKVFGLNGLDLHGFHICPLNPEFVFVVETAHDRIGLYNINNFKKVEQFNYGGESTHDKHHINDILVTEDSIYLSMFSIKGIYDRKLWHNDGAIVRIGRKKMVVEEIVAGELSGPHTIYQANDDIFFCDSINRRVYRNRSILCEFTGFTRGIYFTNYTLFIGQSKKRRIMDTAHRFLNNSIEAGIHCFVPSGRTSTFIPIPFTKNIYSVIAI